MLNLKIGANSLQRNRLLNVNGIIIIKIKCSNGLYDKEYRLLISTLAVCIR